MSRCSNSKCNKNPLNSSERICVTCDGDFVCNEECKIEYIKQRDMFFNNIGNDEFMNEWWKE